MADSSRTSYDEVPYESHPFAQTHPDRLATVATLLGQNPAPADCCRVLELGCAAGGNLLPMADQLPGSTFLGIDLSRVQIAQGRELLGKVGLKNVELRHLSILDIGPDLGKFDYILCHGVYSWVPEPVRDKILSICKEHLNPPGVAYVSYNTYPGWHMRGMIRDMLSFHVRYFREPRVRVKQARNLLDFLARTVAAENTPYSLMLKSELESFRRSADAYLYHEHLEDVNEPVYFYQFAERAAARGLCYLAEVDFRSMVPGNYPPEVENVLQMLSQDNIHMEQYMDFLRNRMFRQTLLCHDHVTPNYSLRPEQLVVFHVASPARPQEAGWTQAGGGVNQEAKRAALASDQPITFETPDGITLQSREPLVKAAMVALAEVWPQAVPFRELLKRARALVPAGGEGVDETPDVRILGQSLLTFYASASTSLVELSLRPPRLTAQVSERPVVGALARAQAAVGTTVTNRRHQLMPLGDLERHLVTLLDGTRDRQALLEGLSAWTSREWRPIQKDGKLLSDGPERLAALGEMIDQQLTAFSRGGLLMA